MVDAHVPARSGQPRPLVRSPGRSAARPQHHDRRQAAAAGPQEPALERVQVHGAGRRAAERVAESSGGWTPRPSGPEPGADRRGVRGVGHRHRHPARQAADHLRGVPAGRREHEPQVRRHRPRPGHQPRAGEPARRRDSAAKHAAASAARSRCICRCATPDRRRPAIDVPDAPIAGAGVPPPCASASGRRRPSPTIGDEIAAGDTTLLDRRGRPALRARPDRPGARQRLQGPARDARRGRAGAGAAVQPDRGLARRVPARHARLDRAEPAQAGSAHASHPGADRDARRGSAARPRARRVLVRHQADVEPKALHAALERIKSLRAARAASGCSSSRTTPAEQLEHPRTARPRRHRHRRPPTPAQQALDDAGDGGVRLRRARPAAAGHVRLRGARADGRERRAGATCRSSSSPAASCRPTRRRSCTRSPAASSSRASSRRSGCSTRPRCSCTASSPTCRRTSRQMLERLHRSDEALDRQDGAGRRRRRAQYLRAQQRARAARDAAC